MQKTNASQLSSKNVVRNFTAFDLIDNDVLQYLQHCACSFLIFLQRFKCVACCFVYYHISITLFFLFKLAFGLFQTHSEKLFTRTAVLIVINMPSWSTHEIELLISEIEETQCFWNMLNPEYKDRIKKSYT